MRDNTLTAPVQISKNGKPVAVMVSMHDYEKIKELKMQMLKERALRAKAEIAANPNISPIRLSASD